MAAFLVLLQNGKYLVLREEWIENPILSTKSKVFFSPISSAVADFTENSKYFLQYEKASCYMAYICKRFDTIIEGEKYLENREPRTSRWLSKRLVDSTSPQTIEDIDLISSSSDDDDPSNKENIEPKHDQATVPQLGSAKVSTDQTMKLGRVFEGKVKTDGSNQIQSMNKVLALKKPKDEELGESDQSQQSDSSTKGNELSFETQASTSSQYVHATDTSSIGNTQLGLIAAFASQAKVFEEDGTTGGSTKVQPVQPMCKMLILKKPKTEETSNRASSKKSNLSTKVNERSFETQASTSSQYVHATNTPSIENTQLGSGEVSADHTIKLGRVFKEKMKTDGSNQIQSMNKVLVLKKPKDEELGESDQPQQSDSSTKGNELSFETQASTSSQHVHATDTPSIGNTQLGSAGVFADQLLEPGRVFGRNVKTDGSNQIQSMNKVIVLKETKTEDFGESNQPQRSDSSTKGNERSFEIQATCSSQIIKATNISHSQVSHSNLVEVSAGLQSKSRKRSLSNRLQTAPNRPRKMGRTSMGEDSKTSAGSYRPAIENDKSMIQSHRTYVFNKNCQPKLVDCHQNVSVPSLPERNSKKTLLRRDYLPAKKE